MFSLEASWHKIYIAIDKLISMYSLLLLLELQAVCVCARTHARTHMQKVWVGSGGQLRGAGKRHGDREVPAWRQLGRICFGLERKPTAVVLKSATGNAVIYNFQI